MVTSPLKVPFLATMAVVLESLCLISICIAARYLHECERRAGFRGGKGTSRSAAESTASVMSALNSKAALKRGADAAGTVCRFLGYMARILDPETLNLTIRFAPP